MIEACSSSSDSSSVYLLFILRWLMFIFLSFTICLISVWCISVVYFSLLFSLMLNFQLILFTCCCTHTYVMWLIKVKGRYSQEQNICQLYPLAFSACWLQRKLNVVNFLMSWTKFLSRIHLGDQYLCDVIVWIAWKIIESLNIHTCFSDLGLFLMSQESLKCIMQSCTFSFTMWTDWVFALLVAHFIGSMYD